jgi:c-di-GMP-binding flagellar brake protein YcgR
MSWFRTHRLSGLDARREPTLGAPPIAVLDDEEPSLEVCGTVDPGDSMGSEDHFRIRDPIEIASILRDKARSATLVAVGFGADERDSYMSVIVEVHSEAGLFVIDAPAAWSQRRRLLAAPRVELRFELNKVPHRLTASRPREREAGTVTLTLPESLLRYQRREFFRIDVPVGAPLRCRMRMAPDEAPRILAGRVVDISLGGMGMRLQPGQLAVDQGMRLDGVEIELPGAGSVRVDLEVRSVLSAPPSSGRRYLRVGMRFVDLGAADQRLIQRYINQLQVKRLQAVG